VCLKRLLRRIGVAEVPDQYERVLVGRDSGDQSSRNIRVPRYCAHCLPAKVVQRQVLLLALDVPNRHKASAASCCQDMRDLLVPVQCSVFVGVRPGLSESERLRIVIEIVHEELAFGASGGEDVRSEGVELYRLDGTGVLVDLLDLGVAKEVNTWPEPLVELDLPITCL
jgi:hypothetical protein